MSRRRQHRPGLVDLVIGDRVLIAGDHPHAGKIGTIAGRQPMALLGKMGTIVNLDDGCSCFVFTDSSVVPLDRKGYPR